MADAVSVLKGSKYADDPNFIKARKILDAALILPADESRASTALIPKKGYKAAMMADRRRRGLKT